MPSINCGICGQSGVSAAVSRIYEHAKTKQHKVLPCRLCERIFLSGLSLDAHLRGKHGETEPPNQSYYCLICERSFGQEDSFQMHSVTKHYKPVRCAECGESFTDWIKFSAHKKSHRQVEITTSVATNPIDSIQVDWGAEDNSQPAASESPWVTVTRFTGGTANHTNKGNEETFACKPCNKVFTFKDGMLQHQISTHGQIMKCPEHSCKKPFSQWALYSAHRRDTGHGVDPELRRSDPPIVGSSGFKQLSTLSAIASPFFTSTKNEKIDIPGKFTCPKCSVSHESQNGLDIHIAVHHPELRPRCEVCSSTFDLTFRLNEHLDNCPRTCNLCEKKLRNQAALDEHISSHHAASKCETCGEKYDPKDSQKHWDESTAHPHCRICKSGFVDTPELKKHMKSHRCSVCDDVTSDIVYSVCASCRDRGNAAEDELREFLDPGNEEDLHELTGDREMEIPPLPDNEEDLLATSSPTQSATKPSDVHPLEKSMLAVDSASGVSSIEKSHSIYSAFGSSFNDVKQNLKPEAIEKINDAKSFSDYLRSPTIISPRIPNFINTADNQSRALETENGSGPATRTPLSAFGTPPSAFDSANSRSSIRPGTSLGRFGAQRDSTSVAGTSTSESRWRCRICMGEPHEPLSTTCGHIFCHRCIMERLFEKSLQCPVCERSLFINLDLPL